MNSIVMKSVLGALAGASLMFAVGAASATTIPECQAQIAALGEKTADATFVGRNSEKDEAGLLQKLSDASLKLGLGKFADASKKVTQYRDKVEDELCPAGKIVDNAEVTCQMLIDGANGVLTCISQINP